MLNLLPLLLAKAGAATITTKVVVAGAVSAAALGTAGATGAIPVEELLQSESTSVVVSDETPVEEAPEENTESIESTEGEDTTEGDASAEGDEGAAGEDTAEGEETAEAEETAEGEEAAVTRATGLDRATQVAAEQAQETLAAVRQAAALRAQERQDQAADGRGAGNAKKDRAPQAPAQETEQPDAPTSADAAGNPQASSTGDGGRGRN